MLWVLVTDPSLPQILQPPVSVTETSLSSLETRDTSYEHYVPEVSTKTQSTPSLDTVTHDEPVPSKLLSSPSSKRNTTRRYSTSKEPPTFQEMDFPVKYVLCLINSECHEID